MLRAARVSRHLTRGEYVAPASVRASEQVVGSGWWWVVVLGDGWWVLVGVGWYFSFRLPYAVFFLLAQLLCSVREGAGSGARHSLDMPLFGCALRAARL